MLSAELRDSVTLMLQTYGGHFLPTMTRKRTHLLLPYAHGDKYGLAMRSGVKPVTVAWLVDSCHEGARQLPAGQDSQAHASAAALRARGQARPVWLGMKLVTGLAGWHLRKAEPAVLKSRGGCLSVTHLAHAQLGGALLQCSCRARAGRSGLPPPTPARGGGPQGHAAARAARHAAGTAGGAPHPPASQGWLPWPPSSPPWVRWPASCTVCALCHSLQEPRPGQCFSASLVPVTCCRVICALEWIARCASSAPACSAAGGPHGCEADLGQAQGAQGCSVRSAGAACLRPGTWEAWPPLAGLSMLGPLPATQGSGSLDRPAEGPAGLHEELLLEGPASRRAA